MIRDVLTVFAVLIVFGSFTGCLNDDDNESPTCSLSVDFASGYAPLDVIFSMNATDDDGSISSWDLDVDSDETADYSGSADPPATQQHTYSIAGAFTAQLTVKDNDGETAIDTVQVQVSEPQLPDLTVDHISLYRASPQWGVFFNVTVIVSNNGTAPSSECDVIINITHGSSDTVYYLVSDKIGVLQPGENWIWTTDKQSVNAPGLYSINVAVKTTFEELDKSNNYDALAFEAT